MKVVKFGGSSVACASQLHKVAKIIEQDQNRKMIVVSAPGKRSSHEFKVTDQLIRLGHNFINHKNYESHYEAVIQRFNEIIEELNLDLSLLMEIEQTIQKTLTSQDSEAMKMDAIKAIGEDSTAKILAEFLNVRGLKATYINPKEAGIIVSHEPGNAQLLPESFPKLYALRKKEGVLVIPGFFGYTKGGDLITFSRGGSDITGSIIAAGVKAERYENFTDVNSVYSVNPNIVKHPKEIKTLTYREMRELSYAGFSVFHDEALIPAFREQIPVSIKNTNQPDHPGTHIIAEKNPSENGVVGIASDTGFCSIYVSKFLMNREIGFVRKLLSILEDEGIPFEHVPSGIDDLSVIIRENKLTPEKERTVSHRIQHELDPDTVTMHRDLAMIMVVGEGLANTIGIANKATCAIAKANVNIEMINQGSSEVSIMFGVQANDLHKAIQSLYLTFFDS